MKNLMNIEFQNCVGSKLIEIRKMKIETMQVVSITNLTQIRLMRVSHKHQKIMNIQLQHCVKWESIEMMNMKMYLNEFGSISNPIQVTRRSIPASSFGLGTEIDSGIRAAQLSF
jgi:hypothetical protein